MPPAIDALSQYQVGIQTLLGTPVAATAQLAIQRMDFDESGVMFRPQLAKGLMIRNRGNELPTAYGSTFSIPDTPVYYEQLQTFFNSFIDGGNVGTGVGPFVWTFVRSMTTDPALAFLTLERRVRDFTTNEDVEIPDSLIDSMTFRYVENEPLRFSLTGFGRKSDDTSLFTAAQLMPAPLEFAPSALARVFINDTFGTVGTTQITAQVIGFEWTFNNGCMPQMTADGRANLDYTIPIHNPENMSLLLRLTCLVDPTRFATERDAAKAGTLRVIRLQVSGTGGRDLKIDGLYKYTKPGILALGTQNGQAIVLLELEETNDGTNFMQAIVTNATSQPDGQP